MSFYSQSQSMYSQQGWTFVGARTPAPPREWFGLPQAYVLAGTSIVLSQVIETDAGRPVAARKMRPVAAVTEATTARPIVCVKRRSLPRASEVNACRPATFTKRHTLARLPETGSARPTKTVKVRGLPRIFESNMTRPIQTIGGVTVYVDTLTPGHLDWGPDGRLSDVTVGRMARPSGGHLS